ncbi:MAG: trypsin-like peptidase domain-containing protein [Rhodospirillaceae bacterium]
MKPLFPRLPAIAASLALGVGLGMVVSTSGGLPKPAQAAPALSAGQSQSGALETIFKSGHQPLIPVFERGAQGVLTIAPMLERVTPAVVNVAVAGLPEGLPEELAERLGDDHPLVGSAGSGVIVDAANGYVMTNHHVIEGAKEITLTLKDGRVTRGRLIGSDPGTDIAVLQINLPNLTALPFARADRVQVGDLAIAIGNPFGLGQAVSMGIISGLGRSGLIPDGYEDFIQTDAAINVGNSGGALVNSNGQLVGINTAILSRGGGNVGVGFAIPTDIAQAVLADLVTSGQVNRGRLGVAIRTVSPRLADNLGLDIPYGVLVAEVFPGTPAERAGLAIGDVILALNGRDIADSASLRRQIGLGKIGESVTLRLLRRGEMLDVRARIGQ